MKGKAGGGILPKRRGRRAKRNELAVHQGETRGREMPNEPLVDFASRLPDVVDPRAVPDKPGGRRRDFRDHLLSAGSLEDKVIVAVRLVFQRNDLGDDPPDRHFDDAVANAGELWRILRGDLQARRPRQADKFLERRLDDARAEIFPVNHVFAYLGAIGVLTRLHRPPLRARFVFLLLRGLRRHDFRRALH